MCGQVLVSMANIKLVMVLVSTLLLPLFATTESTNRVIPRLIFRTSFENYDELHPNLVQVNQQAIQKIPTLYKSTLDLILQTSSATTSPTTFERIII